MKEVVSIELVKGNRVFVEADRDLMVPLHATPLVPSVEGVLEGDVPVGRIADILNSREEIQTLLRACTEIVQDGLAHISNKKKIALEIGIKFAGEAGVPVVAKTSAEASLNITIEW